MLLYNRNAMQTTPQLSYRVTFIVWFIVVVSAALGTLWVVHARPSLVVTQRATDASIYTVLPFIGTIEYENEDPAGRAFRWLPDAGEVRIIDGSLRDVIVRLHAHTGRPPHIPTQLVLQVAGRPVLATTLAPGWRTLHILVPYQQWHDAYASMTYRVTGDVPTDRRLLGLAVDGVQIEATRLPAHGQAQWFFAMLTLVALLPLSLRYPRAWVVVIIVVCAGWMVQLIQPMVWTLSFPQYWAGVGWLLWVSMLWGITPYRRALFAPPVVLVLVLVALWLLRTEWVWLGATLLLGAWYGSRLEFQSEAPWSRSWVVGVLVAAVVVGGLLRILWLNEFPQGMFRDEARHGGLAQLIMARQYMIYSPFANLPAGYFYLAALPISWFGPSAFAIRISAAVIGVVTIPVAYWALRLWWGDRTALLTSVVLSTLLWHVGMSRIGFPASAGPLLTLLAIGMLWRALTQPQGRVAFLYAIGAGGATGAMMHGYHSSRLMPLVVLGMVVAAWYHNQWRWRSRVHVIALWGIVALLVAAPMLWYAFSEPYNYMKRIDSTSLSALALREGVPFGVAVVRNLVAYLGALFIAGDNNARHFYMGMPQLTIVEGSAFLVALGMFCLRRTVSLYWLAWYGGVATLPGLLSVDAPHALRTVESIVPIAIVVAYGFGQLLTAVRARWQPALVVGVLVCTTCWSGMTYLQWQRDNRAYAEFDGQITRAITYVQQYYQVAQMHDTQWYVPQDWRDGDVGVYMLRNKLVGVVSADARTPSTASTQLMLLAADAPKPQGATLLALPATLAARDDLVLWCIGNCDDVDWLD